MLRMYRNNTYNITKPLERVHGPENKKINMLEYLYVYSWALIFNDEFGMHSATPY